MFNQGTYSTVLFSHLWGLTVDSKTLEIKDIISKSVVAELAPKGRAHGRGLSANQQPWDFSDKVNVFGRCWWCMMMLRSCLCINRIKWMYLVDVDDVWWCYVLVFVLIDIYIYTCIFIYSYIYNLWCDHGIVWHDFVLDPQWNSEYQALDGRKWGLDQPHHDVTSFKVSRETTPKMPRTF